MGIIPATVKSKFKQKNRSCNADSLMQMEKAIVTTGNKNTTKTMGWKHEHHKAAARHNPGLHPKDAPLLVQVGSLRAGQSNRDSHPRLSTASWYRR